MRDLVCYLANMHFEKLVERNECFFEEPAPQPQSFVFVKSIYNVCCTCAQERFDTDWCTRDDRKVTGTS